ncbi:phage/plasmid primase, P4 family [Nitratidesulfovibrio liaohensis]|uniref:Phage/plasmid primase, P4 family n=1 Tax=Nitratidesulfovibrio liaohensis TaxID=2604158 RepID=A0ABY9QY17_9BACT|nr:phage/plasmid primase, P4 family [Nitratidesulfovibrio liaohensis]WMW64418.1 phage/plasmid primase, P4 family [Nitratidesulfovibrio liaohensis]
MSGDAKKPPLPLLADGTPDMDAVADMAREEIETERLVMWQEALKKDKGRTLDEALPVPPDTPALWDAEKAKKEERRQPSLPEMKQYMARNELGDAELLRREWTGRMVYDHTTKTWYRYTGIIWERQEMEDQIGEAMALADLYDRAVLDQRTRMKEIDDEDGQEKKSAAKQLEKLTGRASTLRGHDRIRKVLKVAASGDNGLATTGSKWNQHPLLLACANGVIDLETGRLLRSTAGLYLSQQSPYPYLGLHHHDAWWDEHMHRILCGREELIRYVGNVLGYATTGLQDVKEFWVVYGPKADNGKSKTFEAIQNALGSYADSISVGVLLADKNAKTSGPDPELLDIQGLRMAIASEPDQGSKFSMGRIKALTGDDVITTRDLYSGTTKLKPVCKLLVHCNFIPNIQGADRAFANRMRVIPFDARFVRDQAEVDPANHVYAALPKYEVTRRIKAAGPAILSMLVRHAREYLRDRDLAPPPIVLGETSEYFADQDIVGEFIEMCCVTGDRSIKSQSKDLYNAFRKFCLEEKSIPEKYIISNRSFGELLKQRFERKVSNKTWYFGVAPKSEWLPLSDQTGHPENGDGD